MNKEISKLITLQRIDDDIATLNATVDERQQELHTREQAIGKKNALITEKQERVKTLEQRQNSIELERGESHTRIKDRQNKIMQVQTSREHQALLKEIGEHKQNIKDLEEEQLQSLEEMETLSKEAEELTAVCATEQELLDEESDKVAKAIKKIDTKRKKLDKQRSNLSKELRPATCKRYNKLLEKRQGVAITEVRDSVCQGCHMTLPPQQYNEILRGDKLHFCPTCQRMLFYLESDEKEA